MHRPCVRSTLSVLVALSLSGCSAILIRAPNKHETPVRCDDAPPWPWIDLVAMAAVQGAAIAVAASDATGLEPPARIGIGFAGALGVPALLMPSMSYGFGRMRQCHRLHVRDEHPPLTLQPDKLEVPGAPRADAMDSPGKRECTDEQIREAGVKALEAAAVKVARTRPQVESVWMDYGRGPCGRKIMLHVGRGMAGARLTIYVRAWGCGMETTPLEAGLAKQVHDSLHESLRSCDPTPIPDEPPLLEPVGYPRKPESPNGM